MNEEPGFEDHGPTIGGAKPAIQRINAIAAATFAIVAGAIAGGGLQCWFFGAIIAQSEVKETAVRIIELEIDARQSERRSSVGSSAFPARWHDEHSSRHVRELKRCLGLSEVGIQRRQ